IFYASILELIGGTGRVIGIDIDIRPHNRQAIEEHPMSKRISMISGSSVDDEVVREVARAVASSTKTLVILDSNHSHRHVLEELRSYAPFVKADGYLIVLDTVIEYMASDSFPDRPWGRGDNPMTAVEEFLQTTDRF